MPHFMVPIRFTHQGYAYVEAENAGEALHLINKGEWSSEDLFELVDWETTGAARENK